MIDPTLLTRGRVATHVLWTMSVRRLDRLYQVVDVFSQGGIQASIVRFGAERWLVVPGTGYGDIGACGRRERMIDWRRNLRCWPALAHAFAMPRTGASGCYRWASGFLDAAERLDQWIGGRTIHQAFGHSQGGAIVQILGWSLANVLEVHAVGSARPAFDAVPASRSVHVWVGAGDPVPYVPLGAHHVGRVHHLGRGTSWRHLLAGYMTRF